MKISSNWLHTFLPVHKSPEELDQILTDTGLEVEGFETIEVVKGGLEGVVVAEVLTCEQHPNADRLKVTTVNNGKEILQVVCGAPNVAAGQKVILAQVGATLYPEPDKPLKMKVSKIREVESYGMLCAEDELGLGHSHDGILVLPEDAKTGMPIADFLELENDVQLEIGLTPNRADAMGHVGVARDVLAYMACHENSSATLELPMLESLNVTGNLPVDVRVENDEKCPRYMGITIEGVKVEPSPNWLQNRMRAVGLSPINNVVDVTNFVMRELGTPLHAFDAKVVNGNVIVRTAKPGEKMITLDGVERQLDTEDLIIANAEKPMCIAGVFGGNDSGIKEETTSVFLEAAYFQPVSIRKTAKRFGLNTDASFRFERGVDVDMVPYALQRAALLIQEVAGGHIGMEAVNIYPERIERKQVLLRFDRCNKILGHEIEPEVIANILKTLDFEIIAESEVSLTVLVPNYRVDVLREIDVIEEILRIYGFNQVPMPAKLNSSLVVHGKPDVERIQLALSEMLSGMGFHETMNNSLTTPDYVAKFGCDVLRSAENVEMLNPLSQDLAVMRQSMLFQALEVVAYNQNRQNPDLRLYEFGKTYKYEANEYRENKRLILVITGRKEEESWASSNAKVSLFTLKQQVNNIFDRLGLLSLLQEEAFSENSLLADGYQLRVLKEMVGQVGWISPAMKKQFGLKQDVFVADLNWDAIVNSLKLVKIQAKELPKTFAVRRDFSLLLDEKVQFAQIEKVARKADKKLLQAVGLFDVYEGKNLEAGKKSYAVSFTFQDPENTLKDAQIDHIMQTIRTGLEQELGAELR